MSDPTTIVVPELVSSIRAMEILGYQNKMAFWRARERGETLEPDQTLACGPLWAAVDLERWAAGERGFARAVVPQMAGFQEAAKILKVNPATVHRWRAAAERGEGSMVLPVQECDRGPLWVLADVQRYARDLRRARREARATA